MNLCAMAACVCTWPFILLRNGLINGHQNKKVVYTSYHRKGSTKFEHARTHYGRICVSMAKNKYMAKRKRKEKMSYNKMALKIIFF